MLILRTGVSDQTARRISVLVFSVCMVVAFPAALVSSAALSIALISVATFGYSGALANVLALPRDVFPKNAVASIWGLASMGSGFGGMIFSLATGWLVDHYSFRPVFMLFGMLPIVAAILIWTLPRVRAQAANPLAFRT
jgi:ACS family hexuronate transporter-like MFS transporter